MAVDRPDAQGPEVAPDDHALAARLATDAGRLLVDLRARATTDAEAAGRPVDGKALGAEGDRQAHELLMDGLAAARPDDAVLSEEGVADPARLRPHGCGSSTRSTAPASTARCPATDWAVHVALVVDGVPAAGAVALPARGLTLATDPAPPPPPGWGGPPRVRRQPQPPPGRGPADRGRPGRRAGDARVGRGQGDGRRARRRRRLRRTAAASTSGTPPPRWPWPPPPACTCPGWTAHRSSTTAPTPTCPTCSSAGPSWPCGRSPQPQAAADRRRGPSHVPRRSRTGHDTTPRRAPVRRVAHSRSQTMPPAGASPSSSIGSCLSMWPISPL